MKRCPECNELMKVFRRYGEKIFQWQCIRCWIFVPMTPKEEINLKELKLIKNE